MGSTDIDTGDAGAGEDLDSAVYRASREAFDLAKRAASGETGVEAAAEELNGRLDDLWPRLEATPPADQGVTRAWSDARLDVMWLLSGRELTPSPRLAQHLAEA